MAPGGGDPARAPAADESPTWLDRALALVSVALPFGLAVSRAASAGQWRDDLPAVRDLGLVAVGIGGGVSTVIAQALSLVPLGPRTFRAALGSAIALAIASSLLFDLVRRTLHASALPAAAGRAAAPSPRLAAVLAAIATLTAGLSPTWQREATVGGGAMIALALALGALSIALRRLRAPIDAGPRAAAPPLDARTAVALGALAGAALAESPPACLAIVAMVATIPLARRLGDAAARRSPLHFPPPRTLAAGAIAAIVTAAVLFAPLALRPLAPRAWVDVGRALSTASLTALDTPSARVTALGAWTREVGAASLGVALFGAGTAILRPRTRPFLAPLVALIALDTLLPARAAGVLAADPLTALRSLALAAIAVSSALGVHEVVARLLRARVPLARAGAVLVVVFHLTLVALTSEEAGFVSDRSEQFAAEAWADEALGQIEPRAAILVRSPAIAWRLWAARITRGERPDVVVIPVPLLGKGRVASSLVAADRELEPLLRSYALTGEPSEFALSKIADVRPLHVEFDPGWSKRLVSHLFVDGLWLEYAPQPLGPSDRKLGSAALAVPMRRVLAAISGAPVPEASTASVVAVTLRADASVLHALGERDAADLVLARIDELSARDPLVAEVRVPFALKGVRRALLRRGPTRQR